MVGGSGWLSRSLLSKIANTERICSKRKATSRPRFSPASVMTVKCAEWTSSQGGSAANEDAPPTHSPRVTAAPMSRFTKAPWMRAVRMRTQKDEDDRTITKMLTPRGRDRRRAEHQPEPLPVIDAAGTFPGNYT